MVEDAYAPLTAVGLALVLRVLIAIPLPVSWIWIVYALEIGYCA